MDIKDLGHKVEIREPDIFMCLNHENERVYIDYKGFPASFGIGHPIFAGCKTPVAVYTVAKLYMEIKFSE